MDDFIPGGGGRGRGGGGGRKGGRGGGRGGGGGGGFNKHTQGLHFQKVVPKFLQAFAAQSDPRAAAAGRDGGDLSAILANTPYADSAAAGKRGGGKSGDDAIDLPQIANIDELSGVDLEMLRQRLTAQERDQEEGDLGRFEGAEAPSMGGPRRKGIAKMLKEGKISSKALAEATATGAGEKGGAASGSGKETGPGREASAAEGEEGQGEGEAEAEAKRVAKYRDRKEDSMADAIEKATGKHMFRPSAKKRKAVDGDASAKPAEGSKGSRGDGSSANKKRKADSGSKVNRLTFAIADEVEED